MPLSTSDAAHLIKRTGFGVTPQWLGEIVSTGSRQAAVARVTDVSLREDDSVTPVISGIKTSPELFGQLLAQWWFDRMAMTKVPLVEKMTLFWHSHFVSNPDKVRDLGLLLEQNRLFRRQGLGSFHDLVQAVAVDPAMLLYLDNHLNVAEAPQENFARELMEVFTLGVPYRDERDVADLARAWTGHGLNSAQNQYAYHDELHDHGPKALFGMEPRRWNGPDTIRALLLGVKAEQSSRFLTAKLFSFLAYPVTADDAVVVRLAEGFRRSDLSLLQLVRAILLSDEFWSSQARGALVRSPVEWSVAGMQAIGQGAPIARPDRVMYQMGQALFDPPTVAGWGQNRYWLSTATTWAKAAYALELRDLAHHTGVLYDTRSLPPAKAATAAFRHFGIVGPSARSKAVATALVEQTRAAGVPNEVPRNLVHLMLFTPEFQLA